MKVAHHFSTFFCEDPDCGLHITGLTEDNEAICTIIMSREITLAVIKRCQERMAEKDAKK